MSGHVPEEHTATAGTGGEGLAIGTESDQTEGAVLLSERRADLPARGYVPQLHRAASPGGVDGPDSEGLAVGAERQRINGAGTAGEDTDLPMRSYIQRSTAPLVNATLTVPTARVLPSGLNASESTGPVLLLRMPICRWVGPSR